MQTFLPYPDFNQSAQVLDVKRLGNQRREVLQILRVLLGYTTAWQHHPAVKMWDGYATALAAYGVAICLEWRRRGYRDTRLDEIRKLQATLPTTEVLPQWFGNDAFHAAHRSNLLRKNAQHYGQFGWTEPADLPYVWPKNERTT